MSLTERKLPRLNFHKLALTGGVGLGAMLAALELQRILPGWVMDSKDCGAAIPGLDPELSGPIPEAEFLAMTAVDQSMFLRRGGYVTEWWEGQDLDKFIQSVQIASLQSISQARCESDGCDVNWEREHFQFTYNRNQFIEKYKELYKSGDPSNFLDTQKLEESAGTLWKEAWALNMTVPDGTVWMLADFSRISTDKAFRSFFSDSNGQILLNMVAMHISGTVHHELRHASGVGKYEDDEMSIITRLYEGQITIDTNPISNLFGMPKLYFAGSNGLGLNFTDIETGERYQIYSAFEEAVRAYDQQTVEKKWGMEANNLEDMHYYNGARLIGELNRLVGLNDSTFQYFIERFRKTNRTAEPNVDSLGETRFNFRTFIMLYLISAQNNGYKNITSEDIIEIFTLVDKSVKKIHKTTKFYGSYDAASCSSAWTIEDAKSAIDRILENTRAQIENLLLAKSPAAYFISYLLFGHEQPVPEARELAEAVKVV